MIIWSREHQVPMVAVCTILTLAGTGHFASFHGTRGWYDPPCRFAPDWARASRKNEHVARRETKRLICKLKVLGQPVTSEVRSSAEKWRKPVIADNFASDGARAKFQRPACSSRRLEHDTMFLNAHGWFLWVKNSKNDFRAIWRHWPLMTQWFHDLISSLISAKWMSESKSAPQITLEGSRTRKKSAKVIYLIWPQLTSVDWRRTGWPVECMSTTWYYMSPFISLAKTAMFASYVPRNEFSVLHDLSYDVIGKMLGGQGLGIFRGDVKKMGESYIKMVTFER